MAGGCDLLSMIHSLARTFLWVIIWESPLAWALSAVVWRMYEDEGVNGGEMDFSTRSEIIVIVLQRLVGRSSGAAAARGMRMMAIVAVSK